MPTIRSYAKVLFALSAHAPVLLLVGAFNWTSSATIRLGVIVGSATHALHLPYLAVATFGLSGLALVAFVRIITTARRMSGSFTQGDLVPYPYFSRGILAVTPTLVVAVVTTNLLATLGIALIVAGVMAAGKYLYANPLFAVVGYTAVTDGKHIYMLQQYDPDPATDTTPITYEVDAPLYIQTVADTR